MKAFALSLLLCLPFVAFAQLLPLELDQTISLPSSSPVWDVMPHPDGFYVWVQAVQPDTAQITRVYYGRSDRSFLDSVDLAVGAPRAIMCFWKAHYISEVLLASRYTLHSCDSTIFRIYRLDYGLPDSPVWHWSCYSGGGSTGNDYRLIASFATPPPPQSSTALEAAVGHSYHYYWSDHHGSEFIEYRQDGTLLSRSLIDTASSTVMANTSFDHVAYAWSAQHTVVAFSKSSSGFNVGRGNWYASARVLGEGSTFSSPLHCDDVSTHCRSGLITCTVNPATGRSILFSSFYDTAYVAADGNGPIWSLPFGSSGGDYSILLSAHVFTENPLEEFLAYSTTRHRFDIFETYSGVSLGSTDTVIIPADGGARVTGRYDSTSRRLAFRDGDRLKLYRLPSIVGPRPLVLSDFAAVWDSDGVHLTFTAHSEHHIRRYEVWRGPSVATAFMHVLSLPATVGSDSVKIYSSVDRQDSGSSVYVNGAYYYLAVADSFTTDVVHHRELMIHINPAFSPPVVYSYSLSAYPNPFNTSAILKFSLAEAQHVRLHIYDLTGRQVRVLADATFDAGEHLLPLDASTLPSGLYFARLSAGRFVKTQKLLLLK